jgi:hypothetical protein
MATIRGTLRINATDTVLVEQDALLLMNGFPDPQQAASAARDFIVKVRGIPNNTLVDVTGVSTNIGEQAAIVMSDINPAAPSAPPPSGPASSKGSI